MRTTSGLAYGTQSGSNGYDDSTAILAGNWGPNQDVSATVHSVNQQTGNVFEEVELRLRTSISAHSITGYEVNFRCTHDGSQYTQVVRWNGKLGSFTEIDGRTGPGIYNGDTVRATIAGNTISVYINGSVIFTVTDSTYGTGSPGLGFFLQGGSSNLDSDFGFTTYTASDGQGTAPPTDLTATPH